MTDFGELKCKQNDCGVQLGKVVKVIGRYFGIWNIEQIRISGEYTVRCIYLLQRYHTAYRTACCTAISNNDSLFMSLQAAAVTTQNGRK